MGRSDNADVPVTQASVFGVIDNTYKEESASDRTWTFAQI